MRLLIICLMLSSTCFANDITYGYVDVQKVINISDIAKPDRLMIDNLLKENKVIIESKVKEIERIKARLTRVDPQLMTGMFLKILIEYFNAQGIYTQTMNELSMKYNQIQLEIVTKHLYGIIQICQKLSKERNIVIVERENTHILAVPELIDLTEEVIKIYDKDVK